MKLTNRLWRWYYKLKTVRNHARMLNRSVEVQNVLLQCAAGKRAPLTRQECRELAMKLGRAD